MGIKRIAVFGLSAAVLLFWNSPDLFAEQARKAPAKELIQYVQDAARLGLTSSQIEQNAIKAGWPAGHVKDALANLPDAQANPAPAAAADSAPPSSAPRPATAAPAEATASPAEISPASPDEYHIGAGDVLQISVWKEPEASVGSTVVRPDGKIGLPLLKEVEVVGLTPRQAEKIITDRLAKYIPAADVTVVVSAINSKKLYLVGAVKSEGPIPYTYRMTIMQALSEAGGLSDYAKRKKIYILRTQNGKDYRLPFDYDAVLKGERMELNIPLLPGDTIVVPH